MRYLFDANVFIEASNLYYASDVAPGYWCWVEDQMEQGSVASIRAVYEEIARGDDPLAEWARKKADTQWWVKETPEALNVAKTLAKWAAEPGRQYTRSAVDEFMDSADLLLVAQAKAEGATVVTRETSSPASKKRVKIPDAAEAVGVHTAQPFRVYRRLGMRLDCQPSSDPS